MMPSPIVGISGSAILLQAMRELGADSVKICVNRIGGESLSSAVTKAEFMRKGKPMDLGYRFSCILPKDRFVPPGIAFKHQYVPEGLLDLTQHFVAELVNHADWHTDWDKGDNGFSAYGEIVLSQDGMCKAKLDLHFKKAIKNVYHSSILDYQASDVDRITPGLSALVDMVMEECRDKQASDFKVGFQTGWLKGARKGLGELLEILPTTRTDQRAPKFDDIQDKLNTFDAEWLKFVRPARWGHSSIGVNVGIAFTSDDAFIDIHVRTAMVKTRQLSIELTDTPKNFNTGLSTCHPSGWVRPNPNTVIKVGVTGDLEEIVAIQKDGDWLGIEPGTCKLQVRQDVVDSIQSIPYDFMPSELNYDRTPFDQELQLFLELGSIARKDRQGKTLFHHMLEHQGLGELKYVLSSGQDLGFLAEHVPELTPLLVKSASSYYSLMEVLVDASYEDLRDQVTDILAVFADQAGYAALEQGMAQAIISADLNDRAFVRSFLPSIMGALIARRTAMQNEDERTSSNRRMRL
ncbi:hypothetical protein ACKF11_13310 [Methylobacillus sp. Pita2]|uniref:hypothetical protein n=1 Tax=Methylobacillus sp. Pita2 TaxID=3383245 RepID=UPI0038B4C5CB